MQKYVIDSTLKPIKSEWLLKNKSEDFVNQFLDKKYDYKTNTTRQSLYYRFDTLEKIENVVFHKNYLEYLEICWAYHLGAVISPDIIWNILLGEIRQIVGASPDKYRNLFTTSPNKIQIEVPDVNGDIISLKFIIEGLRDLVPNKYVDYFLHDFTTTGDAERLAQSANFADIVSPYYSYWVYGCGIPFVLKLGEDSDWETIKNNWRFLSEFLSIDSRYARNVQSVLNNLSGEAPAFDEMFRLEKCGSGSEAEIFGWITDLFYKQPDSVRKVCNFSSQIAKVPYLYLPTDTNYELHSGLFQSVLENDLLVPEFHYIVLKESE